MSRAASVVLEDGHAFGKRQQKTNGKDPPCLMGKLKTISMAMFNSFLYVIFNSKLLVYQRVAFGDVSRSELEKWFVYRGF